jgi:hypothetical protein
METWPSGSCQGFGVKVRFAKTAANFPLDAVGDGGLGCIAPSPSFARHKPSNILSAEDSASTQLEGRECSGGQVPV